MAGRRIALASAAALLLGTLALAGPPGERPAVENHIQGNGLNRSFEQLFGHGKLLFDAQFNLLDGQGRPRTTGGGAPRQPGQPAFIRTSAPDANSCFGCHNLPRSGGAGDFVVNVFVLAQTLDPVTFSVSPEFSNERNTLGMFGAGPIEMLAREMSDELAEIREECREEAERTNEPVTRDLVAKGVEFGRITVHPDGSIDPTEIEGVDWDLIIKPFHQKGAVVSLREFSNNAMNHHHGMQAVERFRGDADGDGVRRELTVGDITAVTIYQAGIATPTRQWPDDLSHLEAAFRGEIVFDEIGCTECHIPALALNSRDFVEPNPYNPPGNLQDEDVRRPFRFDMTQQGEFPRLEPTKGGGAIVRAFTDLKRHNLNDEELKHFDNEQLAQGSLVGFASPSDFRVAPQKRPTDEFLTRKLWDVGNSMPFGHRGDLTTMTEAIHFHGGEARESRDRFFALPQRDQDAIIEFLRTLQVVPLPED